MPTPRALALRAEVGPLLAAAEALLSSPEAFDPARLVRVFTLRASDGFAETFGPALIAACAAQAPGVRLHFLLKTDKDSASLRDGSIDFETGVLGRQMGPEVRGQALFRDRFIGVMRAGHPLAQGEVTLARYAEAQHIGIARRSQGVWPVDTALAELGLTRKVIAFVGGFATALTFARATDLIATVPARHTEGLRDGMLDFPLPVAVPEITVSLFWHPRFEADPAQRWLREQIGMVCKSRAE